MRKIAAFPAVAGALAIPALADPPLQSPDPPLSRAELRAGGDEKQQRRSRGGSATPLSVSKSVFVRHIHAFHGLHRGHGFTGLSALPGGQSVLTCPLCLHRTIGQHPFHGRFAHQGWWWWGGHGGFGALGTYNGPLVVGVDSPIRAFRLERRIGADAEAGDEGVETPAIPPPPPCDPNADPRCALSRGRYGQALKLLTGADGALPEDPASLRLAALALLGLGRYDDAVAALTAAYTADPTLAQAPLDLPTLLGEAEDRLYSLAVRRAWRDRSAEGWMLAAVLLQGRGRLAGARRMLDMPEAAAIDPAVQRAFARALGE